MTSLALCPMIMSEIPAEYLRSVYRYSQEYPSGLVSLVCSPYWKQYLSMPAYGESEALQLHPDNSVFFLGITLTLLSQRTGFCDRVRVSRN